MVCSAVWAVLLASAAFTAAIGVVGAAPQGGAVACAASPSTVCPVSWYRFESAANLGLDSMGHRNVTVHEVGQHITSGAVGGAVLGPANKTGLELGIRGAAGAVEFLFKTDNTGWFIMGQWLDMLVAEELYVRAFGRGEVRVPLTGTGAKSLDYLKDGRWHHAVITVNATNGVLLCLDGNHCFEGNEAKTSPGVHGMSFNPRFNVNDFAIDEIAVYDVPLSRSMIYAHYVASIKRGVPYPFLKTDAPPPLPSYPPLRYATEEFAPGSQLPSNRSGTQGVTVTALEQLRRFPDPRFPADPWVLALFERNFNWMSPIYLGKRTLGGALVMQEVLFKRWRYGVVFENLRTCCSRDDVALIRNASAYTDSFDSIIMRLETAGGTQLFNKSLPDACFMHNAEGHFIDARGRAVDKRRASLRPMLRDTADAIGCPFSLFDRDGRMFEAALSNAASLLRKVNATIRRVNNDGEAFNIISDRAMAADPVTSADFNRSGAANYLTFWSTWRREMSNPGFRDVLMRPVASSNARFTQYQIQGTTPYFGNWSITREIQDPLKNNQFYSCADFYPRNPGTVFGTRGPWHGIDWMKRVRRSEIAAGNPFFSPFVAAGWSGRAEENIRPGQWLGLLKVFGVWGAEFYYAGFFSLRAPFPNPDNWVWQAAVPSYAQAITMQYHDLFFTGTFLGFIDTGMSNVWVACRNGTSAQSNSTEYVIVLVIERQSNFIGNAVESRTMGPLRIPETDIIVYGLVARQQGSVYRYNAATNVATMLDQWHENKHPWFWAGRQ